MLTFGCARLSVGASPRAGPGFATPFFGAGALYRPHGDLAAPNRGDVKIRMQGRTTAPANRLRNRLHRLPPTTIVPRHSERSAARLAHQSGGLGVPSSNLGAPTKNSVIVQIL